jgi:hypothetical protein
MHAYVQIMVKQTLAAMAAMPQARLRGVIMLIVSIVQAQQIQAGPSNALD